MQVIIFVLSVIFIAEGIFIALWPQQTKNITYRIFRDVKKLRKIGIVEFLIGVGLLVIGLLLCRSC